MVSGLDPRRIAKAGPLAGSDLVERVILPADKERQQRWSGVAIALGAPRNVE
jgi:hypothetical protein